MTPYVPAPSPEDGDAWAVGPTLLWRCSNQPRPPQVTMLRMALATITLVYGMVVLGRAFAGAEPATVQLVRIALIAYGTVGVVLLPRWSWIGLRAYTVGLAVGFSLGVGYCHGVLGNTIAHVPITALVIVATLMPLMSGWDFVAVVAIELLGHAVLLATLPPPRVPLETVAIVVTTSIVAGGVVGMTLLAYRVSLQLSVSSLQRALRAKGEFLNTMSHELRSPLNVIVGYADILCDVGDRETVQLATRQRASAMELLHLVENTMQVARLGAGRLPIHVQEFSPAELIDELAENVRALPESKGGVEVRWSVAPGLPRARLDRLKVKEIVQNLVSNALKFTREGAVSVAVTVEGDQLRIAVQDDGPGIPVESQQRVFEMFERIEDPGSPRAPGVGLGLYIVKNLAHLMQGRIELESQPGVGTCFTVRLPLVLVPAT